MSAKKPVKRKTAEQLAREWDVFARIRHQQIVSGIDLSFQHVLAPLVLDLINGCDQTRILDVGCGTGELTARLGRQAAKVTGLDPSAYSLDIAAEAIDDKQRFDFILGTLEQRADELAASRYTSAVAAMTLMTVPDLHAFAQAAARVLPTSTHLIATITHPCFWPRYWEYEDEPWFAYEQEIFIEAPFRITLDMTNVSTTHIHRPLDMYFGTFANAGFVVETVREPRPPSDLDPVYLASWRFPRFLGIRWRRE